jgi:IQ calmodulin-binding motif
MVLDEEMEQAALKIQSTFRGHKTRKDIKKDETEAQTSDEQPEEQKDATEELDDDIKNMVLDDEMEQAALKIQSTFRGHKTRQDMKKDETVVDETAVDETDNEKEEKETPKEEEPPKEEETASSSSTEKSAKQLQDEEDIAGLVMDSEMEKTALKIQSAFRGKKGFGKKAAKDGDESSASSAGDQQSEDELPDNESPVKSTDDDPFHQNEESSQELMGEKSSYDDEKGSDYSAANNQYTSPEGNQYSVERYNTSYEYEPEPLATNTSTDDINLMQGGGIFPEASGESSQEMLTGSSGDERDPGRNSSYEKVPSDKSYEIDDPIMSEHESVDPLNDEKVIENFDFVANQHTAEAMYYSLKKNEIETQKQLSMEKQLSVESNPTDDDEEKQASYLKNLENQSVEHDNEINEDEDDDDVVVGLRGVPPSSGKRLKYGMSMDDRLLGSILSQDYAAKEHKEGYPDDGFDPMLEAAMRNHHFLEKLHEISNSDDEDRNVPYNDFPDGVGDEDQFDDFYNSNNIRQKIMASSFSIADSDYFDPTNNKSIIEDDKIRTALETIHSTDSESTIGSAATKIPIAGGVARRNNNITTHSMQYSSIGNAAIDKSLDEFIQSQELRIDQFDEEMEGHNSPPPRKHESEEWTDDTTTYTDSDKKLPSGGIIEIKLEQKSFLDVSERRRTLHREDAIQRNSTREDEDSSKSSNVSGEKFSDKKSSTSEIVTAVIVPQDSVIDTEITVPVVGK